MAGSWLLALVVPPPPESGRSGTNTLASDTTNSDPAGHAEVTTSDHHHRGLNDDDDNDDDDDDDNDLNTKEKDESVSSERQKVQSHVVTHSTSNCTMFLATRTCLYDDDNDNEPMHSYA